MAGLLRWRGALVLIVLISLGVAAPAVAQPISVSPTPDPLPESQFQGGDGNQLDEGGRIDWQGLQADGRVGHISDPNAHDTVFAGGNKDLEPYGWEIRTQADGSTPAAGNILDTYRAADRHDGGPAFLYLAFTREARGGTHYMAFELNKRAQPWRHSHGHPIPCRTTGDIMIVFGPHGSTARVLAERWVTTTADSATETTPGDVNTGCARTGRFEHATLRAGVDVQAAFNYGSPIDNFLPVGEFFGASIPVEQFGEAAINLSAVLEDLTGDPCAVFGSTWMHSRSSLSDTANMGDYVAPQPFTLDTCKTTPTLRTSASGALRARARTHPLRRHAVLTQSLTANDTAIIEGGEKPVTGTLTFKLFGPNNDACTGRPAFKDSMMVDGNGAYQLPSFTPSAPGTYRWVVEYSGDERNNGAGPTPCGADTETITISRANPHLTTMASGPLARRVHTGRAGGQIHDKATLSGGYNPTGTITFHLYGPRNRRCRGTPIHTSIAPVNGNGDYFSTLFTPSRAGTYRWVATYSGDDDNHAAGPTPCGDPTETIRIARARPTLTTEASGATVFDHPISDTATLEHGANPTGTIIFRVYGPNNDNCSGRPAHVFRVPVDRGNAVYSSGNFTPPAVGTYRWVATYTGDGFNSRAGPTSCDDDAERQDVRHQVVQPSLSTRVVPSTALATVGLPIRDSATLTGGSAAPAPPPSGTIVFKVYGPNDDSCSRPAAATLKVTVTGNGTHTSGTFTPTQAGVYRWVARYLGDDLNLSARTACSDPAETLTVRLAQPSLSTAAKPSVTLPGFTRDAATLGGFHPTGKIVFELFGPNTDCSGTPAFRAKLNVVGNGVYRSPRFWPRAAGTYRWLVTYSGDRNNRPATTVCGESGEITEVLPHHPSLTTSASPPAKLHPSARRVQGAGRTISDSATLTGFKPTGEIIFKLYGPNTDCSGDPIFTTATTVDGNGIYNSEAFTAKVSGTYRWTATYSGDDNNHPVGPTACDDPDEAVHVTVPAHPSLITSASDAVALGGAIHDTATLSGGSEPTGTITFRLYRPSDAPNATACSGTPLFTSTVHVHGNGDYTSGSFAPTAPGAYLWVARYSGDHANHPASTACREAGETGVVRPHDITPVTPSLSTTVSPLPDLGSPTFDTAHLSGGINPTGAITFKVFGPDDVTCSRPPVFTAVTEVNGNGDYRPVQFVVTLPGTYRWVASYAGDAMNNPVQTACGDPAETATISPIARPQDPAGPNVPPPPPPRSDLVVTKHVNRPVARRGQQLRYTLTVTNKGPDTATNVRLTDTPGLPLHVRAVSVHSRHCRTGPPITCTLGTLRVGAHVTITITAVATTTGLQTNTAAVRSNNRDPHPRNNVATAKTRITAAPHRPPPHRPPPRFTG